VSINMGGTTYGRPDLFASNYLTCSSSSHHSVNRNLANTIKSHVCLGIAMFCVLAAWFARSTTREVRGRPHKVLPF
jgi:hypothetical protein